MDRRETMGLEQVSLPLLMQDLVKSRSRGRVERHVGKADIRIFGGHQVSEFPPWLYDRCRGHAGDAFGSCRVNEIFQVVGEPVLPTPGRARGHLQRDRVEAALVPGGMRADERLDVVGGGSHVLPLPLPGSRNYSQRNTVR